MTKVLSKPSFHAHHSPMGSYGTLTCGMFGASGGLAVEEGIPGNGGLLAGFIDENGVITQFPLTGMQADEQARYFEGSENSADNKIRNIPAKEIKRTYDWSTDGFAFGKFKLEIINPFFSLPDPEKSNDDEQKFASCPAGFIKISYDNSSGTKDLKLFVAFGLDSKERWMVIENGNLTGCSNRDKMGFATMDKSESFIHWGVLNALTKPVNAEDFLLGNVAGLFFNIPAGESREFIIAYGFYLGGNVTQRIKTKYWYTRYFNSVEEVLGYALNNLPLYLKEAAKRDLELEKSPLNDAQKFLIAHATRSYYGSTQWLEDHGKPRWVVNEGEYRMMNTFDLTVDMLFYEMNWNPWTVKNVLDQFVDQYSYRDQVFSPEDPDTMYEGGISFAHDMGVANHFSPLGRSSYEVKGLDRLCFSFMTCEQLTNWVCCMGVYFSQTGDRDFIIKHKQTLLDCLQSLLNRDNPDPEKRNGMMKFESSMTWPGGEITTYDSLDHSLGQSRNNIYLGSKIWAAHLVLNVLLKALGLTEKAEEAFKHAELAAKTMVNAFDENLGFIPAVLEDGNQSAIIPAIEGLVFPQVMGLGEMISPNGPFLEYIAVLKKHLSNILDSGICLYDDKGWKLSSTADNSWMSKICLCQYIARTVLGIETDPASDEAHMNWEIEGSADQACSDQFRSKIAKGSRYYPRIVTNVLWLKEQ